MPKSRIHRGGVRASAAVVATLGAVVVIGVVTAAAREGLPALVTPLASGAQASAPSDAPQPSVSTELTQDDAVRIAHEAEPLTAERILRVAESGPLSVVFEDSQAFDWARAVPNDQPVWYLYFTDEADDLGTFLVIDARDGTVYMKRNLR